MPYLQNGSFEDPYTEREAPEVKVAEGWHAWYSLGTPPQEPKQGPCARPEFKPVYRRDFAYRVLSGDAAQCWFTTYKVMDGGLMQKVSVPIGAKLTFSANCQAWCTNGNDPRASERELYFCLGVDLSGGDNPFENTVWTDWLYGTSEYQPLELCAFATGSKATLYIRAWNKWRSRHADAYVDRAKLLIESPEPPPDPDPVPPAGWTEEQIRTFARQEAIKVVQEIAQSIIEK